LYVVSYFSKGRKSPIPKKNNISQLDQSQDKSYYRQPADKNPDLPSINERLGT